MKKYVCTVCGYIAEGEIPAQLSLIHISGTEQGTAGSGDPSQKPLTDWWSSLLS